MRIAEEAAKKGESNIIMNVLKKVEQENGFETEMAASEMVDDDDNLLDGFMEGFSEEKEEEEDEKDKLDDKADDGVWGFRLAATVAVVSLGAAWLGGHLAKS